MIGLAIIVVGFLYLLLWVAAVFFSYRLLFKVSNSKVIASVAASAMCFLMYFIPFSDLIPTLTAHKHYCETQAGFTVYKTPEQWAIENPGVLETLTPYKKFVSLNSPIGSGTKVNDRFGSIFTLAYVGNSSVREEKTVLIDLKTQGVIAKNIDFSRGYGAIGLGHQGWWKFWLAEGSCHSDKKNITDVKVRNIFYQGFKIGK